MAKWLMMSPKVLIVDEPTRGIDVGSKSEIYGLLSDLAKQGMAITALAGPVSNFLLAYVSAILYSGLYTVLVVRGETTGLALALEFFGVLMTLNIGLGIFNLIPFPPLDGSKVVAMFLSDRQYVQWMRLERYGMIVLMAALWFGLLDGFLGTARSWMLDWMLRGASFAYTGVLSLLM